MKRTLFRTPYRVSALALAVSTLAASGCAPPAPQDLGTGGEPGLLRQAVSVLGSLDVPAGTRSIVNTYAPLGADAAQGATTVSVPPASVVGLGLAPGDLAMVYQAQGAQIATSDDSGYGAVTSPGSAGLYEVFRVGGVDQASGRIQLAPGCALRNPYATAGKAQLVRVPRYRKVTVQPAKDATARGILTASPWNGSTGGVLALHADTISVDGEIDVSGTGFRGGRSNAGTGNVAVDQVAYRSTAVTTGAEQGESIAGAQADYDALGGRYGRGAPANGGGGGNNTNSGGGGGANAGEQAAYTGDGVMGSTQTYGTAWMLDPAYQAKGAFSTSSGGGRGGYTLSTSAQDPTQLAPGSAAWGGNLRRERGGRGGHPLAPDATSRIFFGGGGGGGEANSGRGGAGGAGGGIALLLSPVVTTTQGGCITSAGLPGGSSQDDGAGGGGGGGSIILSAQRISGVNVNVFGGKGGDSSAPTAEINGPGGGGGGGFVAAPQAASLQPELGAGPAGTTSSTSATAFPVNGATDGSLGVNRPYAGALPVCLPADVSVTISATPAEVRENVPARYSVRVANSGPEDAEGLKLSIRVPADTTVASEPQGAGWTCTRAADTYSCTLPSLGADAEPSAIDLILAARRSSPETLQAVASVSADNADPTQSNNTAAASVTVDRTEVRGDGFTCHAAGPGTATRGAGAPALLLGIAAALGLRRRRRGAES